MRRTQPYLNPTLFVGLSNSERWERFKASGPLRPALREHYPDALTGSRSSAYRPSLQPPDASESLDPDAPPAPSSGPAAPHPLRTPASGHPRGPGLRHKKHKHGPQKPRGWPEFFALCGDKDSATTAPPSYAASQAWAHLRGPAAQAPAPNLSRALATSTASAAGLPSPDAERGPRPAQQRGFGQGHGGKGGGLPPEGAALPIEFLVVCAPELRAAAGPFCEKRAVWGCGG